MMSLDVHVSLNMKYSKNPEKMKVYVGFLKFFVILLITSIACGSDGTNKIFDHP